MNTKLNSIVRSHIERPAFDRSPNMPGCFWSNDTWQHVESLLFSKDCIYPVLSERLRKPPQHTPSDGSSRFLSPPQPAASWLLLEERLLSALHIVAACSWLFWAHRFIFIEEAESDWNFLSMEWTKARVTTSSDPNVNHILNNSTVSSQFGVFQRIPCGTL